MANAQLQAITKEIHPQAEKLAKDYINEFAVSLILQAKVMAHQNKADIVLSNHVDEALDNIYTERKQSRSKELKIIIGGAFFGAFLQGFITELSNGNVILIAVYTVLGFIGMSMIFWGLTK